MTIFSTLFTRFPPADPRGWPPGFGFFVGVRVAISGWAGGRVGGWPNSTYTSYNLYDVFDRSLVECQTVLSTRHIKILCLEQSMASLPTTPPRVPLSSVVMRFVLFLFVLFSGDIRSSNLQGSLQQHKDADVLYTQHRYELFVHAKITICKTTTLERH